MIDKSNQKRIQSGTNIVKGQSKNKSYKAKVKNRPESKHSNQMTKSNPSELPRTAALTHSGHSVPQRKRECCSGERDKLKDVFFPAPSANDAGSQKANQGKQLGRRSKSSLKLSCLPAAKIIGRRIRQSYSMYKTNLSHGLRKSPLRSARTI